MSPHKTGIQARVAELLGKAEFELGERQNALEATIDAFLLLPDGGSKGSKALSQRINKIKKSSKTKTNIMIDFKTEIMLESL